MHNLASLWKWARYALQTLLDSHRLSWIFPFSSKKTEKDLLLTWLNYISSVSFSVYTDISIRIWQNLVNFLFLSRARSGLTEWISWYSYHFAVCCGKVWKAPCEIIIASVHSARVFKPVWRYLSRGLEQQRLQGRVRGQSKHWFYCMRESEINSQQSHHLKRQAHLLTQHLYSLSVIFFLW